MERLLELTATPEPTQEPVGEPGPEPEGEGQDESDDDEKKRKKCGESRTEGEEANNQTDNDMKEYKNIQVACGAPALESDKEDHLFLHRDYCEALDSYIERARQNEDALTAKMEEIGKLTSAIEQMKSEHQEAIEKLTAEQQEALTAKEAEISELKAQVEKSQAEIAEKNAELEQLANQPEPAPAPAQAPQSDAAVTEEKQADNLVCKAGMTAKERREALAKRNEELRRQIYG